MATRRCAGINAGSVVWRFPSAEIARVGRRLVTHPLQCRRCAYPLAPRARPVHCRQCESACSLNAADTRRSQSIRGVVWKGTHSVDLWHHLPPSKQKSINASCFYVGSYEFTVALAQDLLPYYKSIVLTPENKYRKSRKSLDKPPICGIIYIEEICFRLTQA